jgi:hypothetical protein
MSERALSPIADDSHSSNSGDHDTAASRSKAFWPAAVAAHADAALDLLAGLNVPDHSVAHDAAQAVDRIRANADAASADDLRATQQHVHHAYAHAEHSPTLSVRVAALDAAAAWRLAQYMYEAHDAADASIADHEQRLARMQQHIDDRVHEIHGVLYAQLQAHVEAKVAFSSAASWQMHKRQQQQIEDLQLAFSDMQEKYDALNEAFVELQTRVNKPASPARKWSLFSAADANAFASFGPQ